MGVLDSILAYKAQKDAQANADINAIPQGIAAFTAAKQATQKSMLDQLTYNMSVQKFNMDAQKQPYELAKLQTDVESAGVTQGLTAAKQGLREVGPVEARRLENRALFKDKATESDRSQKPMTIGNKKFTLDPKLKGAMSLIDLEQNPDMMLAGYGTNGKPYYKSRSYGQFQRELVTENPNIDIDTQKAIAGYEFAEPRIQRIESLIDSGVMGDDETFGKFTKEIFVKGTGPEARYAVKDGSPLEGLMSDLNAIKTTGFSIAGTAYTDSERENIEYGLDPRGKSRSQFKSDVRIIQDYLLSKSKSGTMGLKEARKKVSAFESLSNNKNGASKDKSGGNEIESLAKSKGVTVRFK